MFCIYKVKVISYEQGTDSPIHERNYFYKDASAARQHVEYANQLYMTRAYWIEITVREEFKA